VAVDFFFTHEVEAILDEPTGVQIYP